MSQALIIFVIIAAPRFPIAQADEPARVDGPLQGTVGPYPVSSLHYSIALSSGDDVLVVVYYPGFSSRIERLQRISDGPFPVIIFSPGFDTPADEYQEYLEPLASYGFVVAGASWAYQDDREDDTVYKEHGTVLDYLAGEAADWRSPLYRLVDASRCGAFGHSRGGRTAFMASSVEPRIVCVAAWMPPLDNASDVRQPIPKLIFSGDIDDVCPPDVWQEPLYAACGPSVVYVMRYNGDHSPLVNVHGHITECFLRLHVLGDDAMEPEVYGDAIKAKAQSGEFRLRIKTANGEYDSAPEEVGTKTTPPSGKGGGATSALVVMAVVCVAAAAIIFRRRLLRLLGAPMGSGGKVAQPSSGDGTGTNR
jgi:dienelactone hydrolase